MQGASRHALAAVQGRLAGLSDGLPDAAGMTSVAEGLFAVVRLLDQGGTLRRTLADPTTPGAAKEGLLDALLAGQLEPLPLTVLKDIVAQRWSRPRDLVDAVEVLAVQAIFLVAQAEGSLDDVEDELFRFARILNREPALRLALTDKAVSQEPKTALLAGLLGPRAKAATLRLVEALVANPRGRTLEDGLEDFAALAAELRQRLLAQVTSAVPLTEDQQTRLSAALAQSLGREVALQLEVDPSVLAGLVIRVGDEVIDASTLGRLNDARRRLAG